MIPSTAGPVSREEARAAKVQVADRLANVPGVVGLGLAKQPDGGWCVRVNVSTAEVAQEVRRQVSDPASAVLVQVRVTGGISAAGEP